MADLSLDPNVAVRMGHDEAVAATSIDVDGLLIEFALLPPEDPDGATLQRQWVLVTHYDCDPDKPDQGTSGVEGCGEDREDAENYYLEKIGETEVDVSLRQAGRGKS